VVGSDGIARSEKRRERGWRQVSYRAIGVNRQEFGRLLTKLVVRSHGCPATAVARAGNAARSNVTISIAAASGRFKVVGSALGTASACSGVSISPGSIEKKETPSDLASSAQMAVICRSAALLAP